MHISLQKIITIKDGILFINLNDFLKVIGVFEILEMHSYDPFACS